MPIAFIFPAMLMLAMIVLLIVHENSENEFSYRHKRNRLYQCVSCDRLSRGHQAISEKQKKRFRPTPYCPYCSKGMKKVKDTRETRKALKKMSLFVFLKEKWLRKHQVKQNKRDNVNKSLRKTLIREKHGEFKQDFSGNYQFKIDGHWITVSKEELKSLNKNC